MLASEPSIMDEESSPCILEV